eukprot:scaffold60885_cov21-Tisochrysis_lutea.AAC.1
MEKVSLEAPEEWQAGESLELVRGSFDYAGRLPPSQTLPSACVAHRQQKQLASLACHAEGKESKSRDALTSPKPHPMVSRLIRSEHAPGQAWQV